MPNGDKNRGWDTLGWAEWKGEVGKTLDVLEKNQDTLFKEARELLRDVILLKAKAAIYGTAGGTVAGTLAVVLKTLVAAKSGG